MQQAIQSVIALSEFQPSDEVNKVFSSLVAQVVTSPSITCDASTLHMVQRRCARAETELELFWSDRIGRSTRPQITLEEFPYLDNYRELTRREIELLKRSGLSLGVRNRIAIIGSGPLPLTAWWLWRLTNASITHVDNSQKAITQARALAASLDWPCTCIVADGQSAPLEPDAYDVVYVAGLAGETVTEKQAIIDAVLPALSKNGRIVVRSARGARELLYPAFAATDITHVKLYEEYHPTDEIINSVYVYGRDDG